MALKKAQKVFALTALAALCLGISSFDSSAVKRMLSVESVNFEDFWAPQNDAAPSTYGAPPQEEWLIEDEPPHSDHIPQTITKVFIQKPTGFPLISEMTEELKAAHATWHEMNPDYRIQYFDLKLCREYLAEYFHPIFLRAFDCIEAFAGKNNLFRMAVIYREGGWYSDWKQECLKDDLLNILSKDRELVMFEDQWTHGAIQNAFFGAIPQHPLIGVQLKLIFDHIQSDDYPVNVYWTTGVGVFGEAYKIAYEKDLVTKDVVAGTYNCTNQFYYNNTRIVNHKCRNCGQGQSWPHGNDYKKLHAQGHYYCQDRKSLFKTT